MKLLYEIEPGQPFESVAVIVKLNVPGVSGVPEISPVLGFKPNNKLIKANNYDARNVVLTRTGRAAEGEQFGRQSVEIYQTSMNRGSNSTTLALMHFAESLTAQKKYPEAERILQQAYKNASEVQGTEHWRTKQVEKQLSELYQIWKKPALAGKDRNNLGAE